MLICLWVFFEDLRFTLHLHCPVSQFFAAWSFDGPQGTYITPFSAPFRSEKTLALSLSTLLGIFNPRERVLEAVGPAPDPQSSALSHQDLDPLLSYHKAGNAYLQHSAIRLVTSQALLYFRFFDLKTHTFKNDYLLARGA